MPEPKPSSRYNTTSYTLMFMGILSFVCALILSILASALKVPQEEAKELDRSKQMLIATRILSPYGYFQVKEDENKWVPAQFNSGGFLTPATEKIQASQDQILDVYRNRIGSFLINDKGEATTFEKAQIDEKKYLSEYRKSGYYREPLKLIYKIFENHKSNENKDLKIEGYVIPVNGMGLWDAIYGYLAIKPNGNTVIGISWYDQKETPGLGANIAEADWQAQFPEKQIFQENAQGKIDFKTALLGLNVVKGKVQEILGKSPKALSAVDGMAGATLTGNGVTNAYKDVLAAYRPFLIQLKDQKNPDSKK